MTSCQPFDRLSGALPFDQLSGRRFGRTEPRRLWPGEDANSDLVPKRVLVTGGASCPDGIIQQVIARLNSLLPPSQLLPVESVLAGLENRDTR